MGSYMSRFLDQMFRYINNADLFIYKAANNALCQIWTKLFYNAA